MTPRMQAYLAVAWALGLSILACGPILFPGEHSERHVRIIAELRVSEACGEHIPEIRSARDAWAEAGFPLPFEVVPWGLANVHCVEGRALDRQGVTKWGVTGKPAISLSPVAMSIRSVALHEIGHGLAGDARHHSGMGVMTPTGASSEITADDVQLVQEARHANW